LRVGKSRKGGKACDPRDSVALSQPADEFAAPRFRPDAIDADRHVSRFCEIALYNISVAAG
jgi:hypothetical protein